MAYRLGLDIGITSVGWAVVALEKDESGLKPVRIQDLGVRIFDKAEDSKTGASLALPRREARSARRRTRRRRHRLWRVKRLLEQHGILSMEQIEALYAQRTSSPDVYALRVAGLDRCLIAEEIARVLIHIAHRRGFQSNRKSEIKDSDAGKLLKAVQENENLMQSKGYRTVAEMLVSEATKTDAEGKLVHGKKHGYVSNVRNKAGEYRHTVSRQAIVDEVRKIFAAQRALGNDVMSEELEDSYLKILCSQRNFDDGPGGDSPYGHGSVSPDGVRQSIYERMVGSCTFETGEKRAPRSSYSFERFQLLTKVVNLRIYRQQEDGGRYPCELTQTERARVIDCAYEQTKITYGKLRKLLDMKDTESFAGLTYGLNRSRNKTEDTVFVEMKFYHEVRKALQRAGVFIQDLSIETLDQIGWILSVWKSDDNRRKKLSTLGLSDNVIEELLPLNGSKFGHLSLKAIRKILPFLEDGYSYDVACELAGYQFQGKTEYVKQRLLPPLGEGEVTNPVVRRALSQAIKVVNAVIRKHGSPESIHIELARELSKNLDERRKIEKAQKENQKNNEQIKDEIREILGSAHVTGRDIVKYKLFKQQQEFCMYSGEKLDVTRLFEPGYAEVDHIIPYGISFDDSYDNKVLVKTEQNRQKGNRTPLEYLRDKPEQKAKFIALVESIPLSQKKKNHLLMDKRAIDLEQEGFRERNLSDTRYITRALMNHIQAWLLFDETASTRSKRVVCVNGAVTAYMRARWGLTKDRDAGDKHHAADAVVVACIGDSLIQRVTKYDKFKRNALADRNRYVQQVSKSEGITQYVDKETGEVFTWESFDERKFLPNEPLEPWPFFRDELLARLSDDPSKNIRAIGLLTYSETEQIDPIFVSRMPTRKVTGAAHKETIRSPRIVKVDDNKGTEIQVVVSKVALTELKLTKDGEIKDYFRPEDDPRLYNTLRERLVQFGGDAKAAFKEPVYKISKDGSVRTPVRKVKIQEKLTLGVPVHGGRGIAENGGMVRIDVFAKGGKYYFVPIYVADVLKRELPNRLATAHKPYSEWRVVDDSYQFKFSLYPNDAVMIKPSREVDITYKDRKEPVGCRIMYFVSANIASASISLRTHDNSGELEGLGIQGLEVFEKYVVGPLGDTHPVYKERRMPFRVERKMN
ncbi:HNH endonuclease [Alicyclobacillus hesperidum URH17-3-68]|uniref:type II CRISPR RNA-guided endonuclease Cas9 n=1 Tax=Alicyclobacillus hesperidum TaxID=89784 RepID=UPI000281BB97|nr:type II CRISPR RNA-guided endonuclease Cas9 [Alicyclobacillus hesperidum]EJY56056.1 HNH endonuclease [Alicyclobacillus hesperidum URH17-3-68]